MPDVQTMDEKEFDFAVKAIVAERGDVFGQNFPLIGQKELEQILLEAEKMGMPLSELTRGLLDYSEARKASIARTLAYRMVKHEVEKRSEPPEPTKAR